MKNKILATLLVLASLPSLTNARITGFDTTTGSEKRARGFETEISKIEINPSFNHGASFESVFGKDEAGFKLLINGTVLLPILSNEERQQPKVRIGAFGIVLNTDTSLDIYNELMIDFTAKKIAEGIEFGESVLKCSEPTECSLIDKRGDFWIFNGNRAQGQGNLFSSYLFGHFNFESFSFTGSIMNDLNEFTSEFINALDNQVLEMAPDTLKYFQISSSLPTDDKTYEEHKSLAIEKMESDFGKTKLERMIMKSILKESKSVFTNEVRRSSGSSCTYFCGASGRFVKVWVEAQTDFE